MDITNTPQRVSIDAGGVGLVEKYRATGKNESLGRFIISGKVWPVYAGLHRGFNSIFP